MPSMVAAVAEDSPFTKANRDNWNATSKEYQSRHHAELEGDVLGWPSMPPERELKILGGSVAGKAVLEIACGGGQSAVHLAKMGAHVTAVDFSAAQLGHARAFAKSNNATVRFPRSRRPGPLHVERQELRDRVLCLRARLRRGHPEHVSRNCAGSPSGPPICVLLDVTVLSNHRRARAPCLDELFRAYP